MITLRFASLLVLAILSAFNLKAQDEVFETDKVYLTLLKVEKAADIARCYTMDFDQQKTEIAFAIEDTINSLPDFIYEEDPLIGPDCFVPDMKLIFRNHTYVISLYCSKVIKYHNEEPFTPTPTRVKNDLIITESVLNYFKQLKKEHFQIETPDQELIDKVITSEPFEELTEDKAVLELLLNEEWLEEDEELELKTTENRVLPEEKEVEVEEEEEDPDGGE